MDCKGARTFKLISKICRREVRTRPLGARLAIRQTHTRALLEELGVLAKLIPTLLRLSFCRPYSETVVGSATRREQNNRSSSNMVTDLLATSINRINTRGLRADYVLALEPLYLF